MKLIVACLFIFLIYWLQQKLYNQYWTKKLRIDVHFDEQYAYEGSKLYLTEIIENAKLLPIPLLHVKYAASSYFMFQKEANTQVTDQFYRHNLYSIASYQKITRKYPFVCTKRGYYKITRADIVSKDLFLSNLLAQQYTFDTDLYVLPKPYEPMDLPVNFQTSIKSIITTIIRNEDPFEFKGIREYQPYDNYRMINWRATACTNHLQVNTNYPTMVCEVDILLNLDMQILAHADILQECSIRIAYTIATQLCNSNVPFRLITNGTDCFTQANCSYVASSENHHLKQLAILLARIDLSKPVLEFTPFLTEYAAQTKPYRACVLISNNRKKELVSVYRNLLKQGCHCLYIVPEFGDIAVETTPGLEQIVWEVSYDEKTISV